MPDAKDLKKKVQVDPEDENQQDQQDQSLEAAGSDEEEGQEGTDDFKDPVKAMTEIKKLRAEAAKYRNKAKATDDQVKALNEKLGKLKTALTGEEDEGEDPEVAIGNLKQQNEALQMELSLQNLCSEHDIPGASQKYFKFLLNERFEALEEGEELTEEDVAQVAEEARKLSGSGGPRQNSTGLSKGAKPNADDNKGQTIEQFSKMSVAEKSLLYTNNPNEYNRLFSGAREAGLL